jgi:antitoxin VapB
LSRSTSIFGRATATSERPPSIGIDPLRTLGEWIWKGKLDEAYRLAGFASHADCNDLLVFGHLDALDGDRDAEDLSRDRLPKEFQFATDEVLVRKVGDDIILSPRPRDWKSYLASAPVASGTFMADIEDLPVQKRKA